MEVAGVEIMPVSMENGRSLYALADVARVLGTKTEVLRKRVQRGLTTRPWMNRKGAMFFSEQQVMGMVKNPPGGVLSSTVQKQHGG